MIGTLQLYFLSVTVAYSDVCFSLLSDLSNKVHRVIYYWTCLIAFRLYPSYGSSHSKMALLLEIKKLSMRSHTCIFPKKQASAELNRGGMYQRSSVSFFGGTKWLSSIRIKFILWYGWQAGILRPAVKTEFSTREDFNVREEKAALLRFVGRRVFSRGTFP